MHLVLSVNVKSCKCVWPVHSSPSFGFLTIIIWKTRVTVNHGWLCDSLVLTGYFKAFTVWLVKLLYGLPLSFSSARGQRHVSVSLCSYSLWHWLCRFPRFQTNDMSFLSSQSSGSAQTREELQQALPSQALSLIRFCAALAFPCDLRQHSWWGHKWGVLYPEGVDRQAAAAPFNPSTQEPSGL